MVEININVAMRDINTGRVIYDISEDIIRKYDLKTEEDILKHSDDIPKMTFGSIIIKLFDQIPMETNTDFSTYDRLVNNILEHDDNDGKIKVSASDVKILKELLVRAVKGKPNLNRFVSFIIKQLSG